jgi:hypothetical protein
LNESDSDRKFSSEGGLPFTLLLMWLTWSWEERDPVAWKLAGKEWRDVVTLENLDRLKAFHRIAQWPGGNTITI